MMTAEDRICTLVRHIMGPHNGGDLTRSTTIESIGADSLDAVELALAIEDEFDIDLDNDEANKIYMANTVGDVVCVVEHVIQKAEGQ